MTLKELHERLGWQLDGRLEYRTLLGSVKWYPMPNDGACAPSLWQHPDLYRLRPDAVPLPVHVWVPDYGCDYAQRSSQWYASESACRVANNSAKLVRYVRADREFALSDFDVRYAGETEWLPGSSLDRTTYRLKTEAPR